MGVGGHADEAAAVDVEDYGVEGVGFVFEDGGEVLEEGGGGGG